MTHMPCAIGKYTEYKRKNISGEYEAGLNSIIIKTISLKIGDFKTGFIATINITQAIEYTAVAKYN